MRDLVSLALTRALTRALTVTLAGALVLGMALPARAAPGGSVLRGPTERPWYQRQDVRMVGAVAGVHAGFAAWTYFAWYANQTQSPSLVVRDEGWFGGDTYAGGSDKFGHFLANYVLTRGTAQLFEAARMRTWTRLALANGLTMLSFVIIELKDGYHAGFGFSWGDIIANVAGNAVATLFELSPALDRAVDLRIAYVPSAAYLERLAGDETNLGEDYDGMRFELWLKGAAVDWAATGHRGPARLLRYLSVGVGYRATGFKPARRPLRRQTVSLLVGLDLQTAFDDWLYGGPDGDCDRCRGRAFGRFVTEVATLPYTAIALPVHSVARQGD